MNSILIGDAKAKVMWLLVRLGGVAIFYPWNIELEQVHLVCVFLTDLFNTVGTCYALRSRDSSGLSS
jgi:hypothetical protein